MVEEKRVQDWMHMGKYESRSSFTWGFLMNKEKGFKIELIWGKMLLNEYGWGKRVLNWMQLGKYESWLYSWGRRKIEWGWGNISLNKYIELFATLR